MQPVAPCRARHRQRREERTLQEHVPGLGVDAAAGTAHHASQCQRAVGVGDQQRLRIGLDVLAVQQRERLVCLGHAHDDLVTELRAVEGVHRLAELNHDVVGNIDDRIDAANTAAPQPLRQPLR